MIDVRDARGDRIVPGAYVRLPNGRHAWVVRQQSDTYRGRILLEVENDRGAMAIFEAGLLVTVKPTAKALAARNRAATLRKAVSQSAHAGADRARRS